MNRKCLKRFDNYLIFGIGRNDLHNHKTKYKDANGKIVRCPFYIKWHSMLRRCYSKVLHSNNPAYLGCTVCVEWLTFSNFKSWMETQDWEGKELDKDWIVLGNKIYSPDTCCFIPKGLNNFIANSFKGVDFHKRTQKFRARVHDPFTGSTYHLGLFASYLAANKAYVDAKIKLAKKWCEILPEYKQIIENFISYSRDNLLVTR